MVELIAIVIAVAVLSITSVIITIRLWIQTLRTRSYQKMMQSKIDFRDYLTDIFAIFATDILASKTQRISVAQEKKEAIQKMGPKTFYYLDESQIKDLYSQIFQEPEPKQIETRESKETKKGIAAKLRLIEPKYERGGAEETIKIYDVERIPSVMYNKVEQYLFEKNKVTFGLEEFEFDKSSIDEFKSMCDKMQSKFNFNIPDDLRASFISDKMKEFALQHMKKLSSSSGYVAVQAEFSVVDISDNAYILSFVHPLNDYLPKENAKVRIQITCTKEYITPSGISTFKKDKSVKITCLGKVVSWNDKDKILEISPIAIY